MTLEHEVRNPGKKSRRVRIGHCGHCGHLFKFQRRSAQEVQDGVHLQICPHCFAINNGDMLPSRLEVQTMTAAQAVDHEVRHPGISRIAERIRHDNPSWPEWRVMDAAKQEWHRQQVQTR